ncbi:hypothetical protein J2X69_000857 [Algoriphagus sp. 4150]|uniref:hypothetical protein n=1 Tax=Algoriphagus sp. 4150 TaxID=2817756 RepID=UPI00286649F3|nr:hypothetical protein [Algoriphagus sp. 4150]MDR7128525.1 hypothetical protein [Algoriphagus sp. 4150]
MNSACRAPQSEETLLFESLEKLPSVEIKDASEFSLGNKKILISGKQHAITLKTIQLLSGFSAAVKTETELICLDSPDSFIEYPFAAKTHFRLDEENLETHQLQILSQNKLGATLLYYIKNVGNSPKNIQFQFQANTDLKPSILMDSTFGNNSADRIIFDEMTGIFTAKDDENDWFAVWGSSADTSLSPINSECTTQVSELGASTGFEVFLSLAPQEEQVIPIFISGSDHSEIAAIEVLADLRNELYADWNENFALIDSLTKTAKITIPDQEIQDAYNWGKYKAGLYQFTNTGEPTSTVTNPDDLHLLLNKLSKGFIFQIDTQLFSFDEDKPRHISPSWELIQPMTLLLMGIHGDSENRVTYIRPNFPENWKEVSVDNLWIEDNKLSITTSSDKSQLIVEVTQSQKKAGLSIEFPEEFSKVKVLGKEVSSDTKDGFRRILMTGAHVKIEAKKE